LVLRRGVGDGGLFELLHDGADILSVVLARWGAGLVEDLTLRGGHNAADAVDEAEGILLGPEVDIERMELVVVLVLVLGIVGRQVPLLVSGDVADC